MNDIIMQLSEIENTATSIMDDATISKKNMADEMVKKTNEWDETLATQTNTRIKQLKEEMEISTQKKLDTLRAQAKKELLELEAFYENHHVEYADRLLREFTKG